MLVARGAAAEPTAPSQDSAASIPTTEGCGTSFGEPCAHDIRINFGAGAFDGDALDGGGLVFNALATFRWGHLQVGGLAEGGTQVFGGSYAFFGTALGPVCQMPAGTRLELLLYAGGVSYQGVGCNMFCRSGGASGRFGHYGVRAGGSYVFGRSEHRHFELGLAGSMGADIGQRRVDYTTTGGMFEETTTSHTTTLGGQRWAAFVTMGVALDIGRFAESLEAL
jgi:hypothetical protein